MGQSVCFMLYLFFIFENIYRTNGGKTPLTVFVLMSHLTNSENLLAIQHYKGITQNSEVVAVTIDNTTCISLVDKFKNDDLFSCANFTTLSHVIQIAAKFARNKVCALVESSQLAYLSTNTVEDVGDSYFTFFYGNNKSPLLEEMPFEIDGAAVNTNTGAKYVLFSGDNKCLKVAERLSPLKESIYNPNDAILTQLFSYLSSQNCSSVNRAIIPTNFHRDLQHLDLSRTHHRASSNHRTHHVTNNRQFPHAANETSFQIGVAFDPENNPQSIKEALKFSVHPSGFLFVLTLTYVSLCMYVCMCVCMLNSLCTCACILIRTVLTYQLNMMKCVVLLHSF